MNEDQATLYLKIGEGNSDDKISLPVETYVTIFTLINCENYEIRLCFVNDSECRSSIYLSKTHCASFNCHFISKAEFDSKKMNCELPLIKLTHEETIIGGLCAVLRWTLKDLISRHPEHSAKSLLGFRGGCLTSCAEVSVWTKFCEVDFPRGIDEIIKSNGDNKFVSNIPQCLVDLENHLQMPVRTHNIMKKMQDLKLKKVSATEKNHNLHDNSIADAIPGSQGLLASSKAVFANSKGDFHLEPYVGGADVTLSDIIVFPCVHLMLKCLSHKPLEKLKCVVKWYGNISNYSSVNAALDAFDLRHFEFSSTHLAESDFSSESEINLESHSKDFVSSKVFKKFDPCKILAKLKAGGIKPECKENRLPSLKWEELPTMLHPSSGELPPKRIEKKRQQLNNVVSAVCQLVTPGQTIVDFCSGGGHVGLLLAYILPECKILLVENKEESLKRARRRAHALNLENICFLQCNLDYFNGSFDVGVSLHACGSSTDLVISKCILQKASFVCCPCCYGSIRQTDSLSYPRSKVFRNTDISYKEYLMLAHCADRTHLNTSKYEDGQYCMNLIDSDRIFRLQELGYATELTKLQPTTCSPKHNLLIAVKPS